MWEGGPSDGPVVTLVHGYPGSSHDWAALAAELVDAGHRVLALDLLGFGASPKPVGHPYAIAEQADLVEGLWSASGVTATALVAHDYGISVAQELLARDAGNVTVAALLNGGAIERLYRPTDGQRLLLGDEHGPAVAAAMSRALLEPGLAGTFAGVHPMTAAQFDDLWAALERDDGHLLLRELLHYVAERREFAARWEGALAQTSVPLTFVWGPEDPVSGAHVLEGLRELVPHATFDELDGVAHWPQLEDPTRTNAAILAAL